MMTIQGCWYDGRTSARAEAVCRIFDNGTIWVERRTDGALLYQVNGFKIKASPRVADTSRYLYFTNGEKFETQDNESVDMALERFKGRGRIHLLHELESRTRWVVLCLATLVLFAMAFAWYGVPAAARFIASRLPAAAYRHAGKHTLKVLDRSVFAPSRLEGEKIDGLLKRFQALMEGHREYEVRVLFRKGGPVGPNAFALPNGTIILTDEMVDIADKEDELVAVFAHELGHVVHRHGMRTMIQDSLLGFALMAITGDVSGTSELFLGFPVLLTELSYSRQFEDEADRYALTTLRAQGIPPANFAALMRRIDKSKPSASDSSENKWTRYLSTHPMTEERIRRFEREPMNEDKG